MSRDRPAIMVKVSGGKRAQRVDLTDRVLSFSYLDAEKRSDKLTLVVRNHDLKNFDEPVWRKGNILEVSWGWAENMSPPRFVEIKSVKGFDRLEIKATGGAALLNNEPRTTVYENVTYSEVARAIATRNGWSDPNYQIIQESDVEHEVVSQARMTDAQMCRRLAHRLGWEFFIDFDGFHFHERNMAADPAREWIYYTDDTGEILGMNVENDLTRRPRVTRAVGRSLKDKKTVASGGSLEETVREVTGVVSDFFDTASGAIANADREYITAGSAALNVTADLGHVPMARTVAAGLYFLPVLADAMQETKQEADKRFKKAIQGTVKLTLSVRGDPLVLAKTTFMLGGVGRRLSGKYYIKEARHTIDSSGYKLDLKAISDGGNGYTDRAYDELISSPASKDKIVIGRNFVECDPALLQISPLATELAAKRRAEDQVRRLLAGAGYSSDDIENWAKQTYKQTACRPAPGGINASQRKYEEAQALRRAQALQFFNNVKKSFTP